MEREKLELDGELILGKKKIPIQARYNSKYSILVKFENGINFQTRTEFDRLNLNVDGQTEELGNCSLFLEPNIDGYAGHITFNNDVFNFESLFIKKKQVKLQSVFLNLPLILSHKNNIKRSFKDYTAALNYDLNVYKNLFDGLDKEYVDEPEEVKKSVQKAIIATEGKKFMVFLEEKLDELSDLVSSFTKSEHEIHGFYFRKQLWNIILCSAMMKRTNLKPRGYAGDSEMMRLIYLNDAQGKSTFSKLMHLHPMGHAGAEAVRNRRKLIVEKLNGVQKKFSSKEKLKVLSVACGPAFELQDIITTAEDSRKYHFTLLDQDRAALYEAAIVIDQIEKTIQSQVEVEYTTESVRTMLTTRELNKEWGQFNFIYSLGLFDYLTPPVAKAVLAKLYQILSPGGEIIIGNFHEMNPSRIYMEYWFDWVLYYRSEEEFLELVNPEWNAKPDVFFENTKAQMFLHLKK